MGQTGKIILSLMPFAIAVFVGLFLRISETAFLIIISGVLLVFSFEMGKKFSHRPIARKLYYAQIGIIIFGATAFLATLFKLWFLKP